MGSRGGGRGGGGRFPSGHSQDGTGMLTKKLIFWRNNVGLLKLSCSTKSVIWKILVYLDLSRLERSSTKKGISKVLRKFGLLFIIGFESMQDKFLLKILNFPYTGGPP